MLGNYRVAAQLVGSRVVLSSTELVIGTGGGQNLVPGETHATGAWLMLRRFYNYNMGSNILGEIACSVGQYLDPVNGR
jgi:hypothetical protein